MKGIIASALLSTTAGMLAAQRRLHSALGTTTVVRAFSLGPPVVLPKQQRARSTRRMFCSSLSANVGINNDSNSINDSNSNSNRTALVFDTETTGMVRFRDPHTDPGQPDLVQLGFVLVDTVHWRVRNQGCFLVRRRKQEGNDGVNVNVNVNAGDGDAVVGAIEIEPAAERVHGISNRDRAGFGIEHGTALDVFEDLCRAADVVVGHNLRFDAIVMEAAFYRGRRRLEDSDGNSDTNTDTNDQSFSDLFSSKRHICTMMESVNVCKLPPKFRTNKPTSSSKGGAGTGPPSYKWPSLAEAYGFVTNTNGKQGALENAHDALADSEACLEIFRYLVEHGHVSMEPERAAEQDATSEAGSALAPAKATGGTAAIYDNDDGASKDAQPDLSSGIELANSNDNNHDHDNNRDAAPNSNSGVDRSPEIEETAAASLLQQQPSETSRNSSQNANANTNTTSASGASPATGGKGFRVRGKTYPHKEMIKQLGGKWDAKSKEWVFRDNTNKSTSTGASADSDSNSNLTAACSKLKSFRDLEIVFPE